MLTIFGKIWPNLTIQFKILNHFTTKFNSIDYSISFFPPNSIQKLIQNFEIGCIQFNKIVIQLGNTGIDQGYSQWTSCYLNIWSCYGHHAMDIMLFESMISYLMMLYVVLFDWYLLIFIDIYWYLYPGVECYGCAWVCTLRYLRDHQDFTASWVHQLFPTEGIWC